MTWCFDALISLAQGPQPHGSHTHGTKEREKGCDDLMLNPMNAWLEICPLLPIMLGLSLCL